MNQTICNLLAGLSVFSLAPLVAPADSPGQDDLAAALPRIKPLAPEEALRSFRVLDGFKLEPAATEPLVADPVAACYDADGRLYVVEMRGYPYPEDSPTGYVRRLEDTDGDGRFDRSTIFAPGLSWPTGVVPYDGGVFIAAAPEILYAKDTDGDGVADVRKVMFTGFGTQNVQGLLNGLLWGPDGWIYGVSGINGGLIRSLSRPEAVAVSVRGRDFRFQPGGSAFEAISGGGQFGHSFDDWGHRFTCMNSNHIRQILLPSKYLERNPALADVRVIDDIAEEGGAGPVFRISPAEPWRIVRTRQRASDPAMAKKLPANELVPTGFFTSATGVTIYRGDAFPAAYLGNAFIGDVGGNLVHRKVLTKQGAEFRARRADPGVEFLASTDNWFRPVNFTNTPDGALLILDMYRETIEHPLSIPEPIKKHLDLTSGKDLGRLYNLVPGSGYRHRKPALSRAGTDELVATLADPSSWWRETAQRLLIERRAVDAVPALKALVRARPTALGRLQALWTLDVLGGLGDDDLLLALSDPEAGVREQAARLSEGHLMEGSPVIGPLLKLAGDLDPMVRFQTAFSLGALRANDTRGLDALTEIAVLEASDRWTRAAVLSSIPGRGPALIARLLDKRPDFFDRPEGRPWLDELATMVGLEGDPSAIQAVLARFAPPAASLSTLRRVVFALGLGLKRAGVAPGLVLRGPKGKALDPLFADAARGAASEGPVADRVEAIRLLGLGTADEALASLPARLDSREPTEVQLAALQALKDGTDPRVGPAIVEHWKGLSPAVRREAVEALLARLDRVEALLDGLRDKAITPSDLDPARRTQLLNHQSPEVKRRAETLLGPPSRADRKAVLEAFQPALALEGDRARGKALFAKTCATCHRAEGEGLEVGPDLETVAARTPEDLLVHILDPNREVAANFLAYTVQTVDGQSFSGLIASESVVALTLKRTGGLTEVVLRRRIEAVASTGLSLMPEGLESGLRPQDLADLIAYIRGLTAVRVTSRRDLVPGEIIVAIKKMVFDAGQP
jgi:putative membrane-bound dehydrogenase-like protein